MLYLLHTSLLLNGPRNLVVTAMIMPMDSFGPCHLMQGHLAREAAADCQPAWQLPQQLLLPRYSCALVWLHVQKIICIFASHPHCTVTVLEET